MIDHYDPVILGAQDYYPFGMLSRVAVPNDDPYYRFGFNGKMNDNDVKGLGNEINYGERISDPRTGGRFFSVDPLSQKYPWLSPYQFAGNNPIKFIDLDGAEPFNPDKYVNSDAPRVDAKYKNVTLHEPPLRLGAAEQGIIGAFNASCKAAGLISEIFWASHVDEKYKNQVQFPLTNNNLGFVAKNIIVAPASLAAELKKDPGNAELWGETAMMVVPFLKVKPTSVIVSVPESMEAAMKRVPEEPLAASRLPSSNGYWTGEKGNSTWVSSLQDVNNITGGEGIPFKNGRADFSKWSIGEFTIEGLNGKNSNDFSLVYKQMMKEWGFSSQKAAQDWLKANKITLHHESSSKIQLIPSDLHGNIPHTGSASDLRNN